MVKYLVRKRITGDLGSVRKVLYFRFIRKCNCKVQLIANSNDANTSNDNLEKSNNTIRAKSDEKFRKDNIELMSNEGLMFLE